jgi:hypothetical protein
MIGNLLTAVVLMGAAAPLISTLKSWFSRRSSSPVEIKIGSSLVTLDLAKELTPEQTNAFVQCAVQSARQGDKAGLLKVIEDSHAASASVRLSRSGRDH